MGGEKKLVPSESLWTGVLDDSPSSATGVKASTTAWAARLPLRLLANPSDARVPVDPEDVVAGGCAVWKDAVDPVDVFAEDDLLTPELFEAPLLSRERSTACSVIEGARVRIGLAFVLVVRILCPLLTLPVGAGRLILLLRLGGGLGKVSLILAAKERMVARVGGLDGIDGIDNVGERRPSPEPIDSMVGIRRIYLPRTGIRMSEGTGLPNSSMVMYGM